jgi:hypothetical protein
VGLGKEVHDVSLKDDLLVGVDLENQSAWSLATSCGSKETLQVLWDFAKEIHAEMDLLNAVNSKNRSVWHMAAVRGDRELLDKIWEWAEGIGGVNLTDDLLSSDSNGQTAVSQYLLLPISVTFFIFSQ